MRCRNAILHGSTVEETAKLRLQMLQNKLSPLYHTSSIDPGFILPRHYYLFQIKSLPQCLESSYDDMQFFTRSVTEAQHILQHHEDELGGAPLVFTFHRQIRHFLFSLYSAKG